MSVDERRASSRGSAPAAGASAFAIRCNQCGRSSAGAFFAPCATCRGDIVFDYPRRKAALPASAGSMWDFADRLPVRDARNRVSLGEGATPLLKAASFPDHAVFWKNEGANPTGSQKDRAISVAISVAREHGFERVVTASTGSVGLSCAAYCARTGLPCIVLVPEGTPVERVRPMLALGARVVLTGMVFDEIERLLERLDPSRWYQASTIQRRNCYQSEGAKTIAYEIVLQLGRAPDWMVVPVGGGGTLFGIWKGFEELRRDGLIDRVPRFLGVQARSFNLLELHGIKAELDEVGIERLVPDETIPTVLRNLKHGFPPDAHGAMRALHSSGGRVMSVADDEALSAQMELARREGVFCEPSSGVCFAAVQHALSRGWVAPTEVVAGVITGSGFREQGILASLDPVGMKSVTAEELDQLIA